MSLSLTILNYKGLPPAPELALPHEVGSGGTIGRSPENQCALPDPDKFVSRKHAQISFENRQWVLMDLSAGGTFVVNKGLELHNETATLEDGDRLRIGEYELLVHISPDAPIGVSMAAMPASPLDFNWSAGDKQVDLLSDEPAPSVPGFSSGSGSESSLQDFVSATFPGLEEGRDSSYRHVDEGNALQQSFTPPQAVPAEQADDLLQQFIPTDFNPADLLAAVDNSGFQAAAAAPAHDDFPDIPNLDQFIPEPVVTATPTPVATPAPVLATTPEDDFPDIPGLDNLFAEPAAMAPAPVVPAPPPPTPLVQPAPVVATPVPAVNLSAPQQDVKPKVPTPGHRNHVAPAVHEPAHPASEVNLADMQRELLQRFLRGAGLTPGSIDEGDAGAVLQRAGELLRLLVGGTMMALRGRAEFRSQLRMAVTTIQAANNNPLKFSITPDEALKILLSNANPGYMQPQEAVDDGFADLTNHQMAMTAGIQAGLDELLRHFEPHRFSRQFEEGLVLNKKAKSWEAYNEAYPQLVNAALENFLGEEFADAYEKQLSLLRTARQRK